MLSHDQIPEELRKRAERELESGEQIQWIQMPAPRGFNSRSKNAFLFGLLWLAFALFWMVSGSMGTWSLGRIELFQVLFPMMGTPFILVGLWLLSSPIWAYRAALRTVYVITNRRAITITADRSIAVRSYPPASLSDLKTKNTGHGIGDIIFSRRSWIDSIGHSHSENMGFLQVRDPQNVHAILRQLAQNTPALSAEPDESRHC